MTGSAPVSYLPLAVVLLAALGAAVFHFSRWASLKRKLAGPYFAGMGTLIIGMIWLGHPDFSWGTHVGLPAIVSVVMYVNARSLVFCDACGRTAQWRMFLRPKFCSHCGAPLGKTLP